MSIPLATLLPVLLTLAASATTARGATPDEPVTFSHGDWELACDNTGTCRAAGYQQDGESFPVSVLLTRAAGAGTKVTAELALGQDWDEAASLPKPTQVNFHIDERAHGRIALRGDADTGTLNDAQVKALLAALRRDSRIEFRDVDSDSVWTLSDTGASAVLLKMDDAQGRVGTVGALQRKGTRDESAVPAARAKPVVRAVGDMRAQPGDDTIATRHEAALRAALRAADTEQACTELQDPELASSWRADALEVQRLDADHLLVSTPCWLAAYNSGNGLWVVEDTPPFRATLVTASGTEVNRNLTRIDISAIHKGRGLGDCWSRDTWTWDGTRFVHTYAGTTGLCRGFPGGAWGLPTKVVEVVRGTAPTGGNTSR